MQSMVPTLSQPFVDAELYLALHRETGCVYFFFLLGIGVMAGWEFESFVYNTK